tara:strand:- start:147 stop:302 length:156 start_codon:yes stop_codon:yes gene_type:complete
MTKKLTHIEIAQIEAEARKLRAVAMRDMVQGFGAWLRGLVGGHAGAGARRA